MSDLFTFKFWGVSMGRDRELLGMVNARKIEDAMEEFHPVWINPDKDYVEIVIENAGKAP